MIAFGLSIFLSAFLLFIAQPLLAKKLLPWFGGGPAVWLSIVLFFQTILLLGYLYAYGLTKLKNIHWQVKIHLSLFLVSLIFIPTIPLESQVLLTTWPPVGVFCILFSTLCLPAIIICASSPLLQYWYCHCYKTEYPYRFYGLSNAGSLIGLLAFPFLLEPFLGLQFQLYGWSLLYLLYLGCASICLYLVYQKAPTFDLNTQQTPALLNRFSAFMWVAFTFLSSALLLTVTQIILQDVAGFPLLWVVPLSLYLISFIVTFSFPKVYVNFVWIGLFIVLCAILFYFFSHHTLMLTTQIALFSGLLFSGCMICHGEIYRLKPDKSHLTTYYLFIALGGVLGGLFVNLIAPLIFNQWWDFYLTIFGILLFAGIYLGLKEQSQFIRRSVKGVWLFAFVILGFLLFLHLDKINEDVVHNHRNFFGSFEVTERFPRSEEFRYRTLTNGNILHGKQFLFLPKRNKATTYYSHQSGIGLAIEYERLLHKKASTSPGVSVGVIGLGTGTIAALLNHHDSLRFYEIDPDIETIARSYFYYLTDSSAKTEVVIGDGRVKLNEELNKTGSHQFDILAIDAFSGDSIPVHLLTLEALELYLSHLTPKGILAFHISSRYLDLFPPLQALASKLNIFMFTTHNSEDLENGIFSSQWVLLSKNPEIGSFLYMNHSLLFPPERIFTVWTDDYNYLLSIIRWHG